MPNSSYLPRREADLVTFAQNFDSLIAAAPNDFFVTSAQAATLTSLTDAFVSSYQTARNPLTNSHANIVAKDVAKDALIDNIRQLANEIQAAPGITEFQIAELGLTVRDDTPTAASVPSTAPVITFESTVGRNVTIRLKDLENPDSRAKPAGVDSAFIMTYIGQTPPPPEDVAAWTFQGATGKTITTIQFPATVESGATAWFTAVWVNTRKQTGPPTMPVSTQIPGSLPQAA